MYVKMYVREPEKRVDGWKMFIWSLKTILSPSSCKTALLERIGNEDYLTRFGKYPLAIEWFSGERCWFILLSK